MEGSAAWFFANPSAAASIASAVIAAAVALLVFTITQMITRKREATQLLLPKLEQLYLLLNDLSEQNARMSKLYYLAVEGDAEARRKLNETDDLVSYGLDRAKKIIMYIRLYFPNLSKIHQLLFAAEHQLNALRFEAGSANPPKQMDLLLAAGRVGHFLRLMEEEIIDNRDVLVKSNSFPRRYRSVSQEQINNPASPPSEPFMRTAKNTA